MRADDFNLRHLRALAATVRLGSLSGARLFESMPGRVAPTDAGILLAARADAAAAALVVAFNPQRKGGIGAKGQVAGEVTILPIP